MCRAMSAARPPVAITGTCAPSSRHTACTMPSISPAKPYTAPDCSASMVDLPMACSGSTTSTLMSLAAREVSASSDTSMPGAMTPPM